MDEMDAIDAHIEALRLLKRVDDLFPDAGNIEFKKPLYDCLYQVWRDLNDLIEEKKAQTDKKAKKTKKNGGAKE